MIKTQTFFFCDRNPDTQRLELVEIETTYSGPPYGEWRLPSIRPEWVNGGRRVVLRGHLTRADAVAEVQRRFRADVSRARTMLLLAESALVEVEALA